MKKIEDLMLLNSELQLSKQKGTGMVFKNGVENLGSTQLGDTSMVKIETLVEDKKLLEDPPRTINGASTTTGFEE